MEISDYKNKNIEKKYKSSWYDWLIIYIPESVIKIPSSFKDKFVSLFNRNTPKQTVYGTVKKLSQPKTQNNLKKT